MRRSRSFSSALVLLATATTTRAQTSYPMVTRVQPTALRRGQTAEVKVAGTQDFKGASALLFEGTGLTAEVLAAASTPTDPARRGRAAATGSVTARVTAAADA